MIIFVTVMFHLFTYHTWFSFGEGILNQMILLFIKILFKKLKLCTSL